MASPSAHLRRTGIIALRQDDVLNALNATVPPYTPDPDKDPGMGGSPPRLRILPPPLPHSANLEPFALTSPDQFLPEGPPELTSREYAKALKQVQSLGEGDSTLRTDEQTEIGEYWHYGPRTPPGHWNDIATDIAQAEGLSLIETAAAPCHAQRGRSRCDNRGLGCEIFLRYVAAGHRHPGRRQLESLGFSGPTWLPLITTPNFPEYVSAHSTISAAAVEVLTAFFGKHYEFSFTAPAPRRPPRGSWMASGTPPKKPE